MAVRVYMIPRWVGGSVGYRYDIEHEGEIVVQGSRVPLCDAARWCQGFGKDGILEVWRYGGSYPAMKGEISRYASKTVRETETASPRFVKWAPFEWNVTEEA